MKRHVVVARLIALLAGLGVALSANAGYSCGGLVGYLAINDTGSVITQIVSSPATAQHYICNMNAQSPYQMGVQSCKVAYAALMMAKVSGKSIRLYYSDATPGAGCGTMANGSVQTTTYFVEGPY